MKPKIYAIDYGTSNSLLGAASKNSINLHTPIDLDNSDPSIMRSVVYVDQYSKWLFGKKAVDGYLENPHDGRFFKSLKRFLPEPSFEGTIISGKYISLENLIANQLRFMRKTANDHYNTDVDRVICGHPARFSAVDDHHHLALTRLEKSLIGAGFNHVEFLPEPVAAAHKFLDQISSEKIVLVADFGGGTSDFTVVKMNANGFSDNDVLGLGGVFIAGDVFDGKIMESFIAKKLGSELEYRLPMGKNWLSLPKNLKKKLNRPSDIVMLEKSGYLDFFRKTARYVKNKSDIEKIEKLLVLIEERQGYGIFREIEAAKVKLSANDQVSFKFDYPNLDIEEPLSKSLFEEKIAGDAKIILDCIEETLKSAQLQADKIDLVCCTGGTWKTPLLKESLYKIFGKEKIAPIDEFHSVISGLTIKGQNFL